MKRVFSLMLAVLALFVSTQAPVMAKNAPLGQFRDTPYYGHSAFGFHHHHVRR